MPATISSVSSSTNDGIYKAGATITLTVTFSEAVVIDVAGGRPTLQLATGGLATYVGGSATTSVLSFSYVVGAGESSSDLDYTGTTALALNGATIKDSGGAADAVLTLFVPGTAGSLGANKSIVIDGIAPTLTITTDATMLNATQTATITFTFSEDPGATFTWGGSSGDVTVSGGTLSAISGIGSTRTATFTPAANINGGNASITVAAGSYIDAAGNAGGAGGTPSITFDTRAPAAPASLALDPASDSGANGNDLITSVLRPTFVGAAGSVEALATVRLYDSDGTTVIGSTTAAADGSWLATLTADATEGAHSITAKATDAAGNTGAASATLALTIDRTAPAAPAAPTLAAASDTGASGDGRTTDANPVIEGIAVANAAVVLYDGASQIGTATADGTGKWQVSAPLVVGSHSLSATQSDVAGNVSARSAAFALTIEPPPVPPENPTTIIDGVAVQTGAAAWPGGIIGTTISIPTVSAGRSDSGGAPNVADIPLASSGGANLLLAQLPAGYGLTASGADVGRAAGPDFLTATIKAATPTLGAGDQGQLIGNGLSFVSQPGSGTSLLVMTVTPTSAAPTGALTLSGAGAPAGQAVALVIDARGLTGGKLDLLDIDFAAVVGKADVTARGGASVLSGDGADQTFNVAAGRGDVVFAGGGSDLLSVDMSASATGAKATTMLFGGQGTDIVRFSGNRADYEIAQHNGHVMVIGKADPALKTQIINAEQLQFGDAVVDVANNGSLTTLAGLYQTVLGRQADVGGIEFWADARTAGAGWGSIAVSFIGSSERLAGNAGFNGNAEHDVTLFFNALFHRAPDAEGLAFWSKALQNGASLAQVASGFVDSVEMVGHQVAATDWNFRP